MTFKVIQGRWFLHSRKCIYNISC